MNAPTKTSDADLMQEAYDSLGKGWPLRQPEDPQVLAAWKLASALIEEARGVLEDAAAKQSRPSTPAERTKCLALGCTATEWIASCPLHGDGSTFMTNRIERVTSQLKAIRGDARLATDALDGTVKLSFWESQALRSDLAVLALNAPAPLRLLDTWRKQLNTYTEAGRTAPTGEPGDDE